MPKLINQQNKKGETPLGKLASFLPLHTEGAPRAIALLLNAGAKTSLPTLVGPGPLFPIDIAVLAESRDVCRMLLLAGGSPSQHVVDLER